MPLTLPTHPVAVVPLKLWRPTWFDGVALVVGCVAPDLPYAIDGYGITVHSHAWHALLWWAIPVALIGSRVVRWAAPTVAAHLPAGGPLRLRDYGVLGSVRPRWWVTAWSGVLGAASHIVWDAFTHPYVDGPRILFPALHRLAWNGEPWWYVLSTLSNLAGFVVAPLLIVHIGQRGLLRAWHGAPPETPTRPGLFWGTVMGVGLLGLALLPFQPDPWLPGQAIRALIVVVAALLAGVSVSRGVPVPA
jgi:hypothetical protein